MFENLFKRKKQKNNEDILLEENSNDYEKFQISDLYIAYPAVISHEYQKNGSRKVVYNGNTTIDKDMIIVKFVGARYVENILNGRAYGIFSKFNADEILRDFVGRFMVNTLYPLEIRLKDKTITTLTRKEIRDLLYPESKKHEVKTQKYSDVILQKIDETNQKVNSSSLSKEEKDKLGKELISIANYYVNNLKLLSINNKQTLSLSVNQKSIIDLKKECMAKLVEIEIMLPPENINTLMDELSILEQSILKRK